MIDRATEYAKKVVAGDVVCGKLHYLACKRHLDDIEKSKSEDFPYRWDASRSEDILNYAETLTIIEGFVTKQVELLPFQYFDLGVPLGWVKKENGYRRFRRSYKSMARQNGKTFQNGITASYIAGFSGYIYGKLFTVATKKRQAKLAWDEVAKFVRADPELEELFDIKDYKSMITAVHTMCTIEALSREAGLEDGFRSIFASIDEIHQHRDNKVYKAIYNGTRALPETLISMITTRGDKLNSFCYEMDSFCVNVLKGITTAEDLFIDIHCLDEDDDIWNPDNYIKANPFIAATKEGLEILITDSNTARAMGGMELRDFLIKSLNLWVKNYDTVYVNPDNWKRGDSKLTLEDFKGKSCYLGLDLSSGGDLTSYAMDFEIDEEKSYVYSHSYMPRGRLYEHIESDIAPYDVWEKKGLITVTGSEMSFKNDYKFIISEVKEIIEKYEIKLLGIAVDPHNSDAILSDLEEFGVPVMLITQSAKFLNDATDDIRLQIKSGNLMHDLENELLSWSFCNASVVKNSFGEIKIDKEPHSTTSRIDPCDAVIDARAMRLKNIDDNPIDVDKEMDEYLRMMGWKK